MGDFKIQNYISKRLNHIVTGNKVNIVDMKSYGAMGDGVTNDSNIIQQAIDTYAEGGVLFFPPGEYLINGNITVNNSIYIVGSGWAFKSDIEPLVQNIPGDGTWFTIIDTTITPFTFGSENSRGGIMDCAFYQLHPDHSENWEPTIYPNYIINANTSAFYLNNLMFLTAYNGIKITSSQCCVEKIYGHFFNTGLLVDNNFSVSKIQDIHFWPFWNTEESILEYCQSNTIGIILGQVNGIFMSNIYMYNFLHGIHIEDSSLINQGYTRSFFVDSLYITHSRKGIYINSSQPVIGYINKYHFNGTYNSIPLSNSNALELDEKCSRLNISLFQGLLEQCGGSAIDIKGNNNVICIEGIYFHEVGFNNRNNLSAISNLSDTNVIKLCNNTLDGDESKYTTQMLPKNGRNNSGLWISPSNIRSTHQERISNPTLFLGYLNTGLYNPDSEEIGLSCGGSSMARFNSENIYLGNDGGLTSSNGIRIRKDDDYFSLQLTNTNIQTIGISPLVNSEAKINGNNITGVINAIVNDETSLICTVTFSIQFTVPNVTVMITPLDSDTAKALLYTTTNSNLGFNVYRANTSNSITVNFSYKITGYQ